MEPTVPVHTVDVEIIPAELTFISNCECYWLALLSALGCELWEYREKLLAA